MKTILITPGSHGLGAAIAKKLGPDNQIVISYRSHKDEAHKLAASLPHAIAYRADLEKPSSVENLIKEAEKHFEVIDILIHTASTFPRATIDETDLELWNQTIQNNLTTAFNTFKAVLPGMRAEGWGRIISFIDSGIWSGQAYPNFCAYHCAKAGLMQLIKTVAKQEAKNGITVNAIAPATAENSDPKPPVNSLPIGRYIKLDEITAAVEYLLSNDAGAITGTALPVTGGVGL